MSSAISVNRGGKMDRRKAIKLGLGVTVGTTLGTTTGCAPGARGVGGVGGAREVAQGHTPENMDDYLANLDSQLRRVREGRFVEGFTAQATGKEITLGLRDAIAPQETLFQNILHTLVLTQSFRDISEAGQYHPGMQKRMADNIDSMNATVFQVNDMLANLTPQQREATRETLRKHPGLAMRLGESLDEQAALAGVTTARRIQLRSIMTQTSFRLTHNDPGVVIDEYVNKVRRATEPGKAEISASQNTAYLGSEAFWRYRDQLASAQGGTGPSSENRDKEFHGPGSGTVRTGVTMMGIGAVTFGLSAIFVSNGVFPFVFGMTVGAVLFAIGLIALIVGAIIVAANS